MGGIQWSKGSKADSLAPEVLTTTNFVVLVTCIIYERSEGSGRVQDWDRSSSVLYKTISRTKLMSEMQTKMKNCKP